MSNRIWVDRCEDCYDKKVLHVCRNDIIPAGLTAELCRDCIKLRVALRIKGIEQPPLGLLMEGTWTDAGTLTVVCGDERIAAAIKFLSDGANKGIIRLRFDNKPRWLAAGVFGTSPQRALSEARHFLETMYFPSGSVSRT